MGVLRQPAAPVRLWCAALLISCSAHAALVGALAAVTFVTLQRDEAPVALGSIEISFAAETPSTPSAEEVPEATAEPQYELLIEPMDEEVIDPAPEPVTVAAPEPTQVPPTIDAEAIMQTADGVLVALQSDVATMLSQMRAAAKATAAALAPLVAQRSSASVPEQSAHAPEALPGNLRAIYPEDARRRGASGTTIVRAVVEADGSVSSAAIDRSSGDGVLDDAALEAVRGWHFKPAIVNGTATRGEVTLPVRFVLK